VTSHAVLPLTADTWPAFAALAEKHHGVWGGCWCCWFHAPVTVNREHSAENRAFKQRLVTAGDAHAALVFDGDAAIGWCQYGTPDELPRIYHRKDYDSAPVAGAGYRITCFFVDRDHRRTGVADEALRGALDLIARAGGGLVEAFPQDTAGRRVSSSFLCGGTRTLFERVGFGVERPIGRSGHYVMTRHVEAA